MPHGNYTVHLLFAFGLLDYSSCHVLFPVFCSDLMDPSSGPEAGERSLSLRSAPSTRTAGTHRLLVDPTPGVEVPDIYAVGGVSMAARLRGKWDEISSPVGTKELSDVAVGFSAKRVAKLYLVASGEVFVSGDSGITWVKFASW
jgi:hypothetical protein